MRLAILFVFAALSSWAGSSTGVVLDAAGAVIAGAKIIVTSENGDRKESKSDGEGRFATLDLKPGSYSIEISSIGFRDRKIDGVRVGVEEIRMPAIELSVAAIGGCDGSIPNVCVFTPISPQSSELFGRVSPAWRSCNRS